MQLALYEPQYGYYMGGLQKFGEGGDFITAPELTPLFAQTLANYCLPLIQTKQNAILFEFGAGSGKLCVEILKHLANLGTLPKAYHILELSGELQKRQKDLVQREIPELYSRIHWHYKWPETPFEGIIIANEILDAMPVARFMLKNGSIYESFITLDDNDALLETFKPCHNQALIEYLNKVLPKELNNSDANFYISEANLFINGWISECAKMLNQGALVIIDYGFLREEYYHPDRKLGTLSCHRKHQTHGDFLQHIGEQDITNHVDFTHVAEAAEASGFEVGLYQNQASFLLENGILNCLDAIPEGRERIMATQAVKQLLQPHEMGELFKVMVLEKDSL